MQNDAQRARKRSLRIRAGNHTVCLICYAVAFAIPLLWEYAALRLIYPWKLASTAPDVNAHLLDAFPMLSRWLSPIAVPTAGTAFSLREMLAARESNWMTALALFALLAWGLTLLVQLVWRFSNRSPIFSALPIAPEGAMEIASRSRGTPRIANRFLRRVRDFAEVMGDGTITKETADLALRRLEVDHLGLDVIDHRMLTAIIQNYGGGPVGLETLAATIGEEAITLEDVYEPYLMQLGFLTRTPRGRCVTTLAYDHLHIPYEGQSQFSI